MNEVDEDESEFVFDDDNLSWDTVARASGAYEPSYVIKASRLRNDGPLTRNDKGKGVTSGSTQPNVTLMDGFDEEEEDIGRSSEEEGEDVVFGLDEDDEDDEF